MKTVITAFTITLACAAQLAMATSSLVESYMQPTVAHVDRAEGERTSFCRDNRLPGC